MGPGSAAHRYRAAQRPGQEEAHSTAAYTPLRRRSRKPVTVNGNCRRSGTIFALRLANELGQRFMETVLPEAARGSLAALSSLGAQEAIVCGEGVPLPMRIRFDDLPRGRRPRSEGADFTEAWQSGFVDTQFRDEVVRRWRHQSHLFLKIKTWLPLFPRWIAMPGRQPNT